jgi:hypothetical protein
MARPKKPQPVHSSKKIKQSASKKKRRAAPESDSESVVSEAAALPVPTDSVSDAQDSHGSGGSRSDGEQPLRSPLSLQNSHRSSERSSPHSSPKRAERSQEHTSPHRSLERTSRQSSRSSRRSASALDAADQSEEDLQFVSHHPGIGSEKINFAAFVAAIDACCCCCLLLLLLFYITLFLHKRY